MSLQTPRALTDEDVALIQALLATGTPQAAYSSAVAATPKAQEAAAYAAELAKSAAGLRPLRFDNYRRRKKWSAMSAPEKKLLDESVRWEIEAAEEFEGAELMDVLEDGKLVYFFCLWPFGSGVLVDISSGAPVADVVQHWFNARQPDRMLRESMAVAYHHARERLGIREMVEFSPSKEENDPQAAATPAAGTIDEQIAGMRKRFAEAGERPETKALWKLIEKVITNKVPKVYSVCYRPFPVWRPFELSSTERAAFELLVDLDAAAFYLDRYGLPAGPEMDGNSAQRGPSDLARFLGRAPPGPLDEPIVLDGCAHPAWCLVSDALYEIRPANEVIDRLTGALSSDRLSALWRALVEAPTLGRGAHNLKGRLAMTQEEDVKGVKPAAARAFAQRFVEFAVELNLRLGDAGLELARTMADEQAGRLRDAPTPVQRVNLTLAVVTTLACLGWRAAGRVLDEKYDAQILTAINGPGDPASLDAFTLLLEQLPPGRAAAVAGNWLEFIERFPSAEGATRAAATLQQNAWMAGPYTEKLLKKINEKVARLAKAKSARK
jgi:hypothetical protein